MSSNAEAKIIRLRINYIRAERCWRSNNLKSCLDLCKLLIKDITGLNDNDDQATRTTLIQLKHLVWFLRLRCLNEDYSVNISFLLDEDDVDDRNNKVRVFTSATINGSKSGLYSSAARDVSTRGISRDSRHILSGSLTGKQSRAWSGHSTRVKSSYRPLTTGLTASQTAFSRSTRPLLKYTNCDFLSKFIYDYLYNAQAVTNQCPDYRQCMEYIKLVEKQKFNSSSRQDVTSSRIATLVTSPKDFFWMMSKGVCHFNLRINKEAEEHFIWAISKKPLYVDSYTWLIKTYVRTNELSKILQTCQLGIKNTNNSILFNWMARIHSLMGNLYMANSCLRDSLTFDPMNIEALANVGYFSFYNDKLEQSLKCFKRIQQFSLNHWDGNNSDNRKASESSELLNNLAVCNLYCGFYHRSIPLFNKSFLQSQSNEITSDIWYNLSFVQLSCGLKELAIGCLRLALKNNPQNYEALNNLGVLMHGELINDSLTYENVHEHKGNLQQHSIRQEVELKNLRNQTKLEATFDEAESYFKAPASDASDSIVDYLPEGLFNMALCKWRRGQLLESVKYCKLYMEHDQSNYHIQSILKDIQGIVAHDS